MNKGWDTGAGRYAAGDPRHYTAGELRAELELHFQSVTFSARHERIASVVAPAGETLAGDVEWPVTVVTSPREDGDAFLLAPAARSRSATGRDPSALVAVTPAFEVKWWEDRLRRLERDLDALRERSRVQTRERRELLDELHVSETWSAALAGGIMATRKRLETVLALPGRRLTALLRRLSGRAGGAG